MQAERQQHGERSLALRTRLLAAMLGPLFMVAVAIGLVGATLIADVVRRTNDRVLGGALGAIAETVQVERGEVTLDLPPAAFGMLENGERDNVYYRIAVGGELLTGYADLPAPDFAALDFDQPRFRFARYRGQNVRIAEVKRTLPRIDQPVLIQLAETLDNRAALQRRLIVALLTGEIALIGIAVLLIRPALGWTLRPLSTLRGAVEARVSRTVPDLSPLDTGPLPPELQPLAAAFDQLLGRLDMATGSMRRFTADASHQMRTPLSVLKVQIALAKRGSDEALVEIADAVERLERLLTQLLALARAEESGVAAPIEAVDLREVSAAVISRLIHASMRADVELRLDTDETARFVVPGYRTLLFEMLANLVDNAVRYNRRGGTVTIALAHVRGRVVLSVRDDGPGISEADRERVFERFVRVGSSSGTEGSGLGLAIVRSAAQRIGATVVLVDARPGLEVRLIFEESTLSGIAD
ncbi:MAG: sensor histidine kinase N-terminal domain-containing protein [Sphingobium sp.]